MPDYRFDVKLTGYETVCVEADNEEDAREKALARFEEIYRVAPAWDLRMKTVELDALGEGKNANE